MTKERGFVPENIVLGTLSASSCNALAMLALEVNPTYKRACYSPARFRGKRPDMRSDSVTDRITYQNQHYNGHVKHRGHMVGLVGSIWTMLRSMLAFYCSISWSPQSKVQLLPPKSSRSSCLQWENNLAGAAFCVSACFVR